MQKQNKRLQILNGFRPYATFLLSAWVSLWLSVPIVLPVVLPVVLLADDEAVQKYERQSVTYFRIDSEKAPVPMREKAEEAIRKAVELSRFDINDLGFLGEVSLPDVGQIVRTYLDKIKIKRAREQAEYDVRFKDEIITAEMLQRIVDSAFLYRGRFTSWQTHTGKSSVLIGMDVPAIETVVEAEVEFWKVDFASGSVQPVTSVTAKGIGYSVQFMKSSAQAREASQEMALYWLRRNLSAAIRNIPQFALKINITRAGVNSVWIDMSAQDGVELDSFYKVREKTDSGLRDLGWIKIRKVGDGKREFESRGQILSVRKGFAFDGGELLEEFSQSGLEIVGNGGVWFPSIGGSNSRGLAAATAGGWVNARVGWDMADKLNVPEIWLGGQLSLWVPAPHFEINLEPSIEWRGYFRRTVLGLGLAGGAYRAWLLSRGASVYITHGLGIRPYANLAFWVNPSFQFFGEFGYRLYADLSATGSLNDTDGNTVSAGGFRYNSSGPVLSIGLRFTR